MDQAEQLRLLVKEQGYHKSLARVITVTSGKGGVGKSSISVNLGIQLKKLGKNVIILDADFGLANIEVMLGIRPKYSLVDLLYNNKTLDQIITSGPEGIGFISGGSGIKELANLTREQITFLTSKLYELDKLADIIIIDTGAGISDSVLEFVIASSEVILVTTPEPTSITDAYALLKTLSKKEEFSVKDTTIKVITNRTETYNEGIDLYNKLSIVVSKFLKLDLELLGIVPQDSNLFKAIISQTPVTIKYPSSSSSKALLEIANTIGKEEQAVLRPQKGISELFSKLIRIKNKI